MFPPALSVPRPLGITRTPPPVGAARRAGENAAAGPRAARSARYVLLLGAVGFLAGCFEGDFQERHASAVDAYLATPFVDAEAPFAEPRRALGPPDGRTVALGAGAFIVVRFFRDIPDGAGFDLRVYEVGADGAEARVAVSETGDEFFEFAQPASGTTTEYDLEETGIPSARFVRVRGIDDAGEEPGFDLDAVEALR